MTTVPLPAFELATSARIVFGAGKLADVPIAAAALGARRALVVSGKSTSRGRALETQLAAISIETVGARFESEPTVEAVRAATIECRGTACDLVIAIGGGSALDAAKAIAALAPNPGDVLDYLEVIGAARLLPRPPLPFIAIPSTAGTGSEVTRNAVLTSKKEGVKVSLRSPLMLPRLAVIDPDLLIGAPAGVLLSSGLDALSQLIEPFVSLRANPLTDALARDGLRRSARSLQRAIQHGSDAASRDDLALASLLGGLCLANAGLGAVHGFAAPVGGMFDAPHGAVCAALLLPVVEVNVRVLQMQAPAHPALGKFNEIARLLTNNPEATIGEGLGWLGALIDALGVPGLSHYGMTAKDIPTLVARAKVASSMKGNPIALDDQSLTDIAERAL